MSAVDPLDALAAAIQVHEGWGPRTRSFRNNNPGNLRDSLLPHGLDADGYATFASFTTGWQALHEDLAAKFSGHNTHGLGPTSTLMQLFSVYAPTADHNDTVSYALFVAHWLILALGKTVTPMNTLKYIQEG